ncbi:MAG: tetratricopeptide repeat protein [Bacteroidota bacterium]
MKRYFSILILSLTLFACKEEPKLTTNSAEALKLYKEGVNLLDKFYYAEAKSAFERALQLDSNFAMASARLALVHRRTDNEADAKTEIARAIQKYSRASKREQLFIRMLDHSIHFRHSAAAAVADSFISLYPKEAEIYVLRGNYYELDKSFDAALAMYRKAIEADTSYALAAMSLGYAYSARGDFDKAIEAMERYIRLAPDAADPRASFADILLRAGRYDEALEQYKESLQLKPDYWYSINKIGDVYTTLGRLNEADKQFELGMTKMVMNNQLRASHLATVGILEFLRGKYDETIRLCEQSLALDSTNGKAAFVRVHALLKLKRFDEAGEMIQLIRNEYVRRNLLESSAMLDFHILQAKFFKEQGLFDDAIAACDSAMEYGSELTRTDVHHELAEIHLKKGEFDDALAALEETLRYNVSFPNALLTLTKVYKANGDRQMMNGIGNRLLELWKNADKDFQPLIELKKILSKSSTTLSIS